MLNAALPATPSANRRGRRGFSPAPASTEDRSLGLKGHAIPGPPPADLDARLHIVLRAADNQTAQRLIDEPGLNAAAAAPAIEWPDRIAQLQRQARP